MLKQATTVGYAVPQLTSRNQGLPDECQFLFVVNLVKSHLTVFKTASIIPEEPHLCCSMPQTVHANSSSIMSVKNKNYTIFDQPNHFLGK